MSNKPLPNPNAFTGVAPPWSLTQLDANFTAIQNTINDTLTYSNYFVDQSGVVNSVILSIPTTLAVALTAGTTLYVKIANTNTATTTITINSLVAQTIVNPDGSIMSPKQLLAGAIAILCYDGTNFQFAGSWLSPALTKTSAETTAGVTIVNGAYPEGHVYRYGTNTTPGTTDLTAAVNAAFSLANRVAILPGDTMLITANLAVPACRGIVGAGEFASILQCGSAVTKALSLSSVCNKLADFQILLNGTTGATGIVFGDTTSGAYDAQRVRVLNSTGTNATGFKFYQTLKSDFIKLTAQGCVTGFLIDGTGTSFPTTLTFVNCVATANTGNGWSFVVGSGIVLVGCVSESSTLQGMLFKPGANGTLADLTLIRCWLEANNTGSGYQIVADGTNAGTTVRINIRDCFFNLNGTLKSIQMTGSNCAGFMIENPQFSTANAGTIQIDTSAYGKINLGRNTGAGVVTDTSLTGTTPTLGGECSDTVWTDYTPTLSSDIGNQAATFNGAVTISKARFKRIGKTIYLQISWSGTLNAVTPAFIQMTLPTGLNNNGNVTYCPCQVKNAAVYEAGLARYDGGNNLLFYRNAFATYSSAAAITGYFTGEVELQ